MQIYEVCDTSPDIEIIPWRDIASGQIELF